MKICMYCLEELFDNENVCYKCNNDKLINNKELQQIQSELKSAKRKKLNRLLLIPMYECVNNYLLTKQKRDEKYPKVLQCTEISRNVNPSYIKSISQHPTPTVTCPTCQSTDTRKMGSIERGASILTFGLFSKKINKTFKCNNCGYTW